MVSELIILSVGNQIKTHILYILTRFYYDDFDKFSGKSGDIVLGYDSVKSYEVRRN